ncbi:hypothetical protein P3W85_36815 [Cupriavidus basilensis]|uniref:Uncharacterized protein n=1 Tax=Cupriavidus basilensis TaxID=68895 RepID=A0ABT6B0P7_9BURK|nr:hypothetical protein [Cupriavidus basilensis]MDF3838456.1 hypothetical protein [Cupriavidus basilensis]
MTISRPPLSHDVIDTVVATATDSRGHKQLIEALRRTGLGTVRLGNVRDGFSLRTPDCLVIAPDGNSLGVYREWVQAVLGDVGGDPVAVWRKHKGGELRFADAEIERICFVAPYGTGTAEFYQIIVRRYQYWIERALFRADICAEPRSLDCLLEQTSCRGMALEARMPFGAPSYHLWRIEDLAEVLRLESELDDAEKAEQARVIVLTRNMRTGEVRSTRYFDTYPELRDRKPRLARFFADWDRSSAGRNGAPLTDHWVFEVSDYTNPRDQSRHLTVLPAWTTPRRLPEIKEKRRASVLALWDELLRFDVRAGHAFAWFFFMLHGNRLGPWVGEQILAAAEAGTIELPEHDYRVLKDWSRAPYGF